MKAVNIIVALALVFSCNSLQSADDELVRYFNTRSNFNLIVFFDPQDCIVCLNEVSSLNKLHREIGTENLTVIGILNSYESEQVLKFKQDNNIKFDLYGAPELFEVYTSERTPEQYLFANNQHRDLIYYSSRKKISSSQEATYDIINLIVRNQS